MAAFIALDMASNTREVWQKRQDTSETAGGLMHVSASMICSALECYSVGYIPEASHTSSLIPCMLFDRMEHPRKNSALRAGPSSVVDTEELFFVVNEEVLCLLAHVLPMLCMCILWHAENMFGRGCKPGLLPHS